MGKIKILGREYNYVPYQSQMYMDKLRLRLIADRTFVRVFAIDLTDKFISEMKDIVNPNFLHEMNSIWSVSGLSGTGKSLLVMSLCKMLVPERFSYKNFCFYDAQILEKAKEIPRDSFIIRDEGVDKAIYGVGSQRTSRQLQVLVETARKYGLNIVFIEPEFRVNEITKYYIETVDIDYENRITRCAVKDPVTMQYLGAIYVPVLPEKDKDWIKYNEVKDKFIDDMREGKLVGAKEDYKAIAKDLAEKINVDIFAKKNERLAFIQSELPTMTNAEIKIIHTFVEIILKGSGWALEKKEEDNGNKKQ